MSKALHIILANRVGSKNQQLSIILKSKTNKAIARNFNISLAKLITTLEKITKNVNKTTEVSLAFTKL